jgi:hypothetical protein
MVRLKDGDALRFDSINYREQQTLEFNDFVGDIWLSLLLL